MEKMVRCYQKDLICQIKCEENQNNYYSAIHLYWHFSRLIHFQIPQFFFQYLYLRISLISTYYISQLSYIDLFWQCMEQNLRKMSQNWHSCQWQKDLADQAILSIIFCIFPSLIKPMYCLLDPDLTFFLF